MARPKNLRRADPQVPAETALTLHVANDLMARTPIEGPKPWSDDVERAAIWHTLHAAPPKYALSAAGVIPSTADTWLSDEPPPCYQSACAALSSRLKEAEQACAAGLFANIHKAAQDPRYWTAAAWTLERKHGYVVKQEALSGPATVVNIGQLVVNQAPSRLSWRDDPGAIPAESSVVELAGSVVVEQKA